MDTQTLYTEVIKLNGMPHKMLSSKGLLRIQFLNWVEPNNGRVLWKVDVLFENRNINKQIFENNWNYLNQKIDQLSINDENEQYYFLPTESKGTLFKISKKKFFGGYNLIKIDLPYKNVSTLSFIGNQFGFNKLLTIFTDQINITDLNNLKTSYLLKDANGHIFNARLLNENEVRIDYCKIIDKERVESSVTVKINELTKYT